MKHFWHVVIGAMLLLAQVAAAAADEKQQLMSAAYTAQYENRHDDAIKGFEQAFAKGATEAFMALASYYLSAEYNNPARIEALIQKLENASEQGDAEASYFATQVFLSKEFANASKAFKHAQLAVMNSPKDSDKWVKANMFLANFYFSGMGVEKNIEAGLNTLKRASTVNGKANTEVHAQLGYLYGQMGNIEQSATWYISGLRANTGYKHNAKSLIADIYYQLGHSEAAIKAANEFFSGKPLTTEEIDDLKAFAEDGDHDAQHALAMSFAYGYGVSKDQKLAHVYFKKAVANNDLRSLKAYIQWLDATDTSNASAFPYVMRAAQQNDPKNMARAGDHYLKGIGTTKNAGVARDWAVRAIALGYEEAERVLMRALVDLNPPHSSGWQFYVQSTKGGRLHFANSAKSGPLNLNGKQVYYALSLTKYGSTQFEHYDSILYERDYTNYYDALKIDCNQRKTQQIGYVLYDGNRQVYEALDPGRWHWETFGPNSTLQRLLPQVCN